MSEPKESSTPDADGEAKAEKATVVFIPAWNEEANLGAVLEEVKAALPDADVLVIDDGSTDGTSDVARAGGAQVERFPENRGLRTAVAAGYAHALRGGYEYCGRVDADGQHPAVELCRLLEHVKSGASDVAVGSRFVSGEGYKPYRYSPSAPRAFGIALLRRAMNVRIGQPFADATSGMWAVNSKALPYLSEPFHSGAPEVESLIRLSDEGLAVDEIPVNMRERASGESKLRGFKSIQLVVTVIGTLLAAEGIRRVLKSRRERRRSRWI